MARRFFEWLLQPASARTGPESPALPDPVGSSETRGPLPVPEADQPAAELEEARAEQVKLRNDLDQLMKAHVQQARVLERNRRASRRLEEALARMRDRARALENQADQAARSAAEHAARVQQLDALVPQHESLKAAHAALDRERQDLSRRLTQITRSHDNLQAERERLAAEHAARVQQLDALVPQHKSLKAAHACLDRERQDLARRLTEITHSHDNLQAERERLAAENARSHATLAARDAETAALRVAEDALKERISHLTQEIADENAVATQLKAELDRVAGLEGEYARLKLEHEALTTRCEIALARLAEAEQAVETAQATIKAAQRLSGSLEWRSALDGVIDAASELVRFDRGTLAIVDALQEDLKIEAARNSPIAISEMSRFKLGEGIAGWALSKREPVLVRDSRSDSRFKASDPSHQPRSIIAVPLLAGTDGLGVLTLTRAANDPFNEQDLRNLGRIGNDAANALTNARLVHVLKQRQDELNALVAKTRELWMASDSQQVIASILKIAQELAGGNAALLALRDARSHGLEVVGSSGIPPELIEQRITWGAPAALDVMRSGKPWVSLMREIMPLALAQQVEATGMRMLISLPCQTGQVGLQAGEVLLATRADPGTSEQVSGVLHIFRETPEPISQGQLEQLNAFAEHAASAIKQVRGWERIRTQLQTTASLNARLIGRERYIQQLQFRVQQLEQELGRYKAA